MNRHIFFAYPGRLDLLTGGYAYDRRMIEGLRALGWQVELIALGDGFPTPTSDVLMQAIELLSALPDGATVMIDGLAFGVLDDWAVREAGRLDIVALVHHPLALEAGLPSDSRMKFHASERRALTAARAVIVTSPETARELSSNFDVAADRITIALPGTDKAALSPGGNRPPHILSIGTLIHRKGHDVLIDALAQIRSLDWRCTIVGSKTLDPAQAQMLAARIDRHDLSSRIVLAGERKDTRAELLTADIFAMASRYEGYGMVFAEALSQGVPIVACATGAIPDVVPESAGLLVPPDDPDAFAKALTRLLDNDAFRARMAAGAAEAGAKLPTWQETSQTIADRIARDRS